MARKTAQRETQNGEHQKTKSERNFYGSGNNAGARYKTTEALQEAVDRYFEKALAPNADGAAAEVVSEQGLALFLGVSVSTLRGWFDGEKCTYLQETAQDAYSRMAAEYMNLLTTGNKAYVPFVIFMLKQKRFAGYQDKIEAKQDISVNVNMGKNMDKSDWE